MKHLKKLISLCLITAMLLILTSCYKEVLKSILDSEKENQTSGTITESNDPEESTYKMGSTIGGTYENEFIKIGCQLDSNWTYYTKEQIAQLSGLVEDAIDNEDYTNALNSGKSVYDMCAASSDGLATINIVFENLGVLYGIVMDEADYLEKATETIQQPLESMGLENLKMEKTTMDFAGASRIALAVSGDISGMLMYEKLIFIKQGNYMAIITLYSAMENITDNLASLFYSY